MDPPANITNTITLIIFLASSVILRCALVIFSIHRQRRIHAFIYKSHTKADERSYAGKRNQKSTRYIKTMVILGSGGHTTEMIHLLEQLDTKLYFPVVYIVADSDNTSIARLKQYIDETRGDGSKNKGKTCVDRWEGRYPIENDTQFQNESAKNIHSESVTQKMGKVYRLPRPREVHQSYISSILPTLRSMYHTLYLLRNETPDLILANGPGMCVPLIYLMFFFRILGFSGHCKLIFVESLCRVQTLSLSGKLVYPVVDQFVVHWPSLKRRYPLVNVCDVFVCQEKID